MRYHNPGPPIPKPITPPFTPKSQHTVYAGADIGDGPTQLIHLYRGRDLLCVQYRKERRYYPQPNETKQERRLRRYKEADIASSMALDRLRRLLHLLPFGQTNRVFLYEKDGEWRIHERPMVYTPLPSSRDWGVPVVDIKEVHLTRWIARDRIEGIWNSHPVDIYCPSPYEFWTLERFVRGWHAIYPLGLTFKLYGMLTRDGGVVALMTEPMIGRTINWCDRGDTYRALAELARNGFYHVHVNQGHGNFAITEWGFCIAHCMDVEPLPAGMSVEEIDAFIEETHMKPLTELFDDLRERPHDITFKDDFNLYRMQVGEDICLVPWDPNPLRSLSHLLGGLTLQEWLPEFLAALDEARAQDEEKQLRKQGKKKKPMQTLPLGVHTRTRALWEPAYRSCLTEAVRSYQDVKPPEDEQHNTFVLTINLITPCRSHLPHSGTEHTIGSSDLDDVDCISLISPHVSSNRQAEEQFSHITTQALKENSAAGQPSYASRIW